MRRGVASLTFISAILHTLKGSLKMNMHECEVCGHHHLTEDDGYFDCRQDDHRYIHADFLTAAERANLPASAIINAVEHARSSTTMMVSKWKKSGYRLGWSSGSQTRTCARHKAT